MSREPHALMSLRWPAALVAVALIVGFAGGAVAKGKYDANNAKKVDGRSAVKASASVAKRKGKLVATNPQTGKLPNNIIATAPDATKLDGYSHTAMSAMSFPPQGAGLLGNASTYVGGARLENTGTGSIRVGFVVPPDHDPADPLQIDVVYSVDTTGACDWSAFSNGMAGPDSATGANVHSHVWDFPGSSAGIGSVHVPAGPGTAHKLTLSWPHQDDPGMYVEFGLGRDATLPADNCPLLAVHAIQLRY